MAKKCHLRLELPGITKPLHTAYTVYGDVLPDSIPLIVLHGGPGFTWYYLEPLAKLAELTGQPVVFYDQIGCGESTHLPEQRMVPNFWTMELFLCELGSLISGLGVSKYDLIGHSWGGMLAAAHAAGPGSSSLRKLVISNSPASMPLWMEATGRQRKALPEAVQDVLDSHERDGTTDTKEYEAAVDVYTRTYSIRLQPYPEAFLRSERAMRDDNTVYMSMNGPSEFTVTGSLKTWTIIDQLHKIAADTLLINGKYDGAQDETMQPFFTAITKVKWRTFGDSSHMPHFEESEAYLKLVADFLND